MKREEIEQLLADYAAGEISAADLQRLEACFANDPALKKEADELLTVWQVLGKEAENEPLTETSDQAFYDLIATEKASLQPKGRVVQIRASWIKTAAAIAACALAFVIGRATVVDVAPVIQYKTVYVKQPVQPQLAQPAVPVQGAVITSPAIAKTEVKPKAKTDGEDMAVMEQLRSVYASERMAAVMKLADSSKINPANLKVLAMALNEDPNTNVRLTILNKLRPLASRQNVQAVLISSLATQNDALIKSSIVDLLIDNKSKQAIPQMIAMLSDKKTDPDIQNKIKAGIESFLN